MATYEVSNDAHLSLTAGQTEQMLGLTLQLLEQLEKIAGVRVGGVSRYILVSGLVGPFRGRHAFGRIVT
jgi:hypothetical protein